MMKAAIAAAAAFAIGLGIWLALPGGTAAPKAEVRRVTVERGDLSLKVTATGEVLPVRQIELKSKASGQVVRFARMEGDAVEAGDVLAELDKTLNTRDLERERANLQSAEERLKQAEAALLLVRARKEADLNLARSEVTKARANVLDAEERLRDTEVRAPIKGILLKKLVEEGQIVSSGISTTGGGTAVAIVADVSSLVVVANVDETDIGKIAPGKNAMVSVESQPGKHFKGTVFLIPPKGDVDSSIIVFKVRIAIDGKHFGDLKAGMTATVAIQVDDVKDALLLPSEAVKNERGSRYVLVEEKGEQKRAVVEAGLDDGSQIEIKSGLKEGDEVLIVYASSATGPGPARMPRFAR